MVGFEFGESGFGLELFVDKRGGLGGVWCTACRVEWQRMALVRRVWSYVDR